MFDNGLLKYYGKYTIGEDHLNMDKLDFKKHRTKNPRVYSCKIDGKPYYVKRVRGDSYGKFQADAEILLGQVYNKFGIKSSIYLPCRSKGEDYLVSNDVKKPNVVLAREFLLDNNARNEPYNLPFLSNPSYDDENARSICTENCLKQQTRMRILDTASYNTDRHTSNYFYKLQHRAIDDDDQSVKSRVLNFYRSLVNPIVPNKATDIVTIDHESCGENAYLNLISGNNNEENGEPFSIDLYKNDFREEGLSREEMIGEFEHNEKLENLIDKKEVADEIGALNPEAVSKDIYETIGYQVNPMLVSFFSRSYENMADTLSQN